MGLLDWIIGWFFFTSTLTWPAARRGIPRRGVFFCFLFTSYCQKWSYMVKKVISGPEFLKNEIFDQISSYWIHLDLHTNTLHQTRIVFDVPL